MRTLAPDRQDKTVDPPCLPHRMKASRSSALRRLLSFHSPQVKGSSACSSRCSIGSRCRKLSRSNFRQTSLHSIAKNTTRSRFLTSTSPQANASLPNRLVASANASLHCLADLALAIACRISRSSFEKFSSFPKCRERQPCVRKGGVVIEIRKAHPFTSVETTQV